MIEDALKNIRNVHRLILTISFITLVFSLSISPPHDKKTQMELIKKLIEFNYLEYDSFVDQNIDDFFSPKLKELSKGLGEKIKKEALQIFNLHHIYEAFSRNSHVGKILTEELVFSNTSNATLNQFDALNGLSLNKDVQVVLPDIDGIATKISSFLIENNKTGQRVYNVILKVGDYSFIGESSLLDSTITLNLNFELSATTRAGGSPTFNADFPAKLISLPNTSFKHWIVEKSKNMDIVKHKDGKLVWLPTLDSLPNGFREQKLGLLAKNLEDDIKKSSPEEQKVSILGANVPGILFVYAPPIILLALMYYLMNHSLHLLTLVKDNLIYFTQFSWMPLSLKTYWYIDLIGSIVFFPILSLSVLNFQLNQFGTTNYGSTILLLGSSIGVGLFARIVFKSIKAIREVMKKEKHEPNKSINTDQ